MISKDLLEIPEIAKAVELTKESSYTKEELETYDKYWDTIRTQRTFIVDAESKGIVLGKIEGKIEGRIEGKIEGIIEGKIEGKIETAKNLKLLNILTNHQIADATGLNIDEVNAL
jgi:predicted transposase/invertase (TIGR01784 family)